MFHYWIQRHDYASEEEQDVSLGQAIEAFETFDWDRELAAFDLDDTARNCPPGIGYHNGFDGTKPEGMLLHVCPKDEATVFCNFHYRAKGKFLGIFTTTRQEVHYIESWERVRVPNLIRLFFDHKAEEILRLTR